MKTPAQLLQPLCRFARRLHRNQRGAVAPLFLVSSSLVFGTSIGSIDLMRYTSVKAHLQAALDNAALAAGKLASLDGMDAPLLAEAQGYFQANFPNNYLGSRINAAGLSLQTDGSSLTLTIDGNMPLLTTGFLDISAFGLESSAVVALDGKGPSEVVFALDRGNQGSGTSSGFPGNSGSSGNSNGWKGCENGGGHPNCSDTGTDGDPVIWAAGTLADLLLPEESRGSSVHVGLVPFSEVVNVGAAGKPWVAEWLQEWSGNPRTQYANPNYTENVWRGCIAEPEPWLRPDTNSARALSPSDRFQPVLVQVKTELYDHSGKGNSGKLWHGENLSGAEDSQSLDEAAYIRGQVVRLDSNGQSTDRRLWAEFTDAVGPGKSQNSPGFDVYGAFEPAGCLTANETLFLSNVAGDVASALNRSESASGTSKSLLPAGLLWSWRMLHPDWRGGSGWVAPASLQDTTNNVQKAIVLFSTGLNSEWDELIESLPGGRVDITWDVEGTDNEFSFSLPYQVKECGKGKDKNVCSTSTVTHTQAAYTPGQDAKGSTQMKADEAYWQFPTTSLVMPDPFEKIRTPSLAGWPTVNTYTREVCDAIKADGIEIYVVDVNDTGSSVLSHCSSDGILYSLDRVPELRNVIQVTQTSGEKLRLIR